METKHTIITLHRCSHRVTESQYTVHSTQSHSHKYHDSMFHANFVEKITKFYGKFARKINEFCQSDKVNKIECFPSKKHRLHYMHQHFTGDHVIKATQTQNYGYNKKKEIMCVIHAFIDFIGISHFAIHIPRTVIYIPRVYSTQHRQQVKFFCVPVKNKI